MVVRLMLAVAMAANFVLAETYIGDDYLIGPNEGCMYDKNVEDTTFRCALNDNKVSVNVATNGAKIKIECQETTRIACEEFGTVKKYISDYYGNWTETNRRLQILEVDRCDVGPGSIKCLLDIVEANDTDILYLRHRTLLPEDLGGVESVRILRMFEVDTPKVPYNALSLLPNLESYTMRNAKLELQSGRDLLPNLVNLELAQCEIKSLPKAAFINTPNVQNLLLWSNEIEYIDFDAFEGLTNLVNVSLNQNLISHLPGGLFRHTPHLGAIFLYMNKLMELTEDVFSGLQELQSVILFNNKVPLTLKNRAFSNLPSLYTLDLHDNSIPNVTDDIFNNTTNLKTLRLDGNKLKSIPSELFRNVNLTILNLCNNILEDLPHDVFNDQTSLETLGMNRNLLKSLPTGIFLKLNSLKKLDLRRNTLTSLANNEFRGLNSLKELLLDNNQIKIINETVFEPIVDLEVISLSGNKITIFKDAKLGDVPICLSPLYKLNKLKKLNLSSNNVSAICMDWTDNMFFLKELDLSNNKINFLTHDDMNFASSVTVNLQNNRIQYIQPYNEQTNTATPTFLLNRNPYICNCMLYDFTQMYNDPKVRKSLQLDTAVCSQPRSLKGRKLTDLIPDTLTCEIDCSPDSNLQNISHAPISQVCSSCVERPSKSILEMSCETFPKKYPELRRGLRTISIKLKKIQNLPELPMEVQFIDLSNLTLNEYPLPSLYGFNITTLNLTNNNLTTAPKDLLEKDYVLYLRNNHFECTCETKNDLILLKKYQYNIRDYRQIICSDGNLLISKDIDRLCTTRDVIIILLTIAVISSIVAVFTFIWCKYNTEIRIILRKYNLMFEKRNPDIKFDAYFTFAPDDEHRLRTNEILALENGKPPICLYLHYKHFRIGGYIPDEIAQAVEASNWTVIALSQKYLDSDWSSLELKLAHNKEKIIFLLLEDISQMNPDQKMKKLLSLYPIYNAKDKLACERIRDKLLRGQKNTNQSANKALDVHINENGQLENRAPKALHI